MIAFQRPEITFSARSAGSIGRRLTGSDILTSWSVSHELVGNTLSHHTLHRRLRKFTIEVPDESPPDPPLRRPGSSQTCRTPDANAGSRPIARSNCRDRRQP